jgi:Leucine-rich repeat (LRR) protein
VQVNLRVLNASNNWIKVVHGLESCSELQELDLSTNLIESIGKIQAFIIITSLFLLGYTSLLYTCTRHSMYHHLYLYNMTKTVSKVCLGTNNNA